MPDTVHDVLTARIDRLADVPKRLLQTASILGREFSLRLLEAVWEGGSLDPHLGALTRQEFLYERTGAEDCVTDIAAGSGFYGPTLFDAYGHFQPRPAALFALPVVRLPSPGVATVLGGGYHASGAAGVDRLPAPHLPAGLRLDPQEGAGEVQTPVLGRAAEELRIGDRVYFRHAKAGELCERFDTLHLVDGEQIVASVPTYRGEGKTFL